MAHLLINTKEEKLFKKLSPKLPEGTTIVVSSMEGKPLRRLKVSEKKCVLDVDFVENERPFTKKEKETYMSGLTKTSIVDFFLTKDDDVPYREWSACYDKEWELMSHLRHGGYYYFDPTTGEAQSRYDYDENSIRVGGFKFWVPPNAKSKSVLSQLNFVLKRVCKHFPQVKKYPIGIMESTLSEFGCYDAIIDLEKKLGKVIKTIYGRSEDLSGWMSYKDLVTYIKTNCPYKE
jgi:hypothetical protein